jgi:hypothetical protein
MNQLAQNVRSATPIYLIRISVDLAVEFVGFVIFGRSLLRTGVWGWQQLVGGFLTLLGAVDGFVYTLPPYSKAILEYQMWKEAGASHMWFYPCAASTGDR